ncbi:MAG TPA: phosphatase, partial [Rubrobacteraceae bacterium]|nr:phosphatase [Rubrobacteraceae bacterium]
MDTVAAKYAERLLAATVAGTNTSHGARGNLEKIHMLLEGNSSTTFGMEDLLRGVTYEEAYGAVAERIGNPPDREKNAGRGCIDPTRTAAGLLEAGGRIRAVAEGGGSAVFATGHPGALLVYYLGLASWFEDLGGKALLTEPRIRPDDGGPPLDWVGPVAVLG